LLPISQQTPAAPEEMARFFDVRAEGYENHMRESFEGMLEEFYAQVASSIPKTTVPIRLLDLGCGTGLELEYMFNKAPNALITGIDMSAQMLERLQQKYAQYASQLHLVRGSYIDIPFKFNEYDYAVLVMTMHHLLEEMKRDLYRRIRAALKDGGVYIEGDYVVDEEEEQQLLQEYHKKMKDLDPGESYHIDIPFTIQRQEQIFAQAGFSDVKTIIMWGMELSLWQRNSLSNIFHRRGCRETQRKNRRC